VRDVEILWRPAHSLTGDVGGVPCAVARRGMALPSLGVSEALPEFPPVRVTLTDGSGAHLLRDVLVLAGFAVAAFAATLVGTARKRRWTVGKLKPELVL
jgi:hypothetical protein